MCGCKQGVRPCFYLDNTDWNEDREMTTHNLLLVGFQDCHPEDSQLDITIPKSQTLIKNSCGTLFPCSKPEKEQFQRTQGMSDYLIGQDRTTSEAIHRHCLGLLRAPLKRYFFIMNQSTASKKCYSKSMERLKLYLKVTNAVL